MQISDLVKVRKAQGIAISPDGLHIAYGLSKKRNVLLAEANGPAQRTLEVASRTDAAQTPTTRTFLDGDVVVSDIAFMPGGQHISYLASEGIGTPAGLFSVALAGGAPKPLFVSGANVLSHSWAPNAKSVFVIIGPGPTAAQSAAVSATGFNARVFEEGARANRLLRITIRPDKKPVVRVIALDGHPIEVTMMPDGSALAVRIAPSPLADDIIIKTRIDFLDPRTGRVKHKVSTPAKIGKLALDPAGRRFALIAGQDTSDPAATTLYMGSLKQPELTRILGGAYAVRDIVWSGRDELTAVIHEGEASRIITLTPNGEVIAETPSHPYLIEALAKADGHLAAIASAPDMPPEVFFLADRAQAAALQRASFSNTWLNDITFAPARSYSYTARDGQRISGVLMEPLDRRRSRKAPPLLLMVHGGPESHRHLGWQTNYLNPSQIAAGAGYAVFFPNYRGSTGRGTAFSKQHQGDYAGKEFNDLVDAIDALAADGIADKARVGITGASYGGYASSWAATALSPRFAAAVSFAGISNQISKFGTTDIPNEMRNVHALQWPWEDWNKMLAVSPITHANQSTTPTLIFHGEADTRVHPSQSVELFRNLKLRGKAPVRLITYPAEGHGLRKTAAQLDYAHRLMRWMDHFVEGNGKKLPPVAVPQLLELQD